MPTRKKLLQYQGSCVENPFPTTKILSAVIDRAREITKPTFFRHCEWADEETRGLMRSFPKDYTFWKSSYKRKPVYFYKWSRIEFFYM